MNMYIKEMAHMETQKLMVWFHSKSEILRTRRENVVSLGLKSEKNPVS